jgi:hypothetical protein
MDGNHEGPEPEGPGGMAAAGDRNVAVKRTATWPLMDDKGFSAQAWLAAYDGSIKSPGSIAYPRNSGGTGHGDRGA